MLRRTLARLAVACSVVAGTVAGVASPAWAPKYILGSFAFGDCLVDGDASETSLSGDFAVESFTNVDGTLYVNGLLTGSCFDGLDQRATIAPGVYSFPVVEMRIECNDEFAGIDVRPGAARVGGEDAAKDPVKITVDLYPSTIVERTWMPGEARSVRGRLCALSRMSPHRDAAALAVVLDQLVLRV